MIYHQFTRWRIVEETFLGDQALHIGLQNFL